MSPTLLTSSALLITLVLPLSAEAITLKTSRVTPRQTYEMRYASSSSRKNVAASSSAAYLDTIRSKDTGMVFKMPANWTPLYDMTGVNFRLERGPVSPHPTSFMSVTRKKLSKPQTLVLLYRTILDKATIDAAGTNLGGPDFYIPSFKITGSGTIKVAGIEALSMSYTGESRSEQRSYRRVDLVKDSWQYTIWLATPPQYLKEDEKVFEGVVQSFSFEGSNLQMSSASSRGKSRR